MQFKRGIYRIPKYYLYVEINRSKLYIKLLPTNNVKNLFIEIIKAKHSQLFHCSFPGIKLAQSSLGQ